ncbi:MAG: tetratricopeptide repeat protein, partial [Planctomycetaceae bacterium]
ETELAKVRFRLAAVYAQLGKAKDAEAQYELAIAGFQSLQDSLKNDPAAQADLALCLHNLASLRKQQGRYETAVSDYQKAVRLQAPLLSLASQDSRYVHEWASTQTNLATLLWACGDHEQADQRFLRTQLELEDHLQRSPEDTESRKQLVECRNSRVAILLERDPDQAESLLKTNIDELLSAQASESGTDASSDLSYPSTLCQLAVARNNLATLLGQRGESGQAIELMQASIQVLAQEATEATSDTEARQQLAIAHNNLGQLYWRQEPDQQRSVREFTQAEAILRSVLGSSMADPDALSRLGGILHNRSVIEQHVGNLDGAMQHVAQAIEYQALAIKKAPLNAIYRRTLESHREQLDHVVEKLQAQAGDDRPTVELKNTGQPRFKEADAGTADPTKDRGGKYGAA